jgi:di/tricarboxylate transporter
MPVDAIITLVIILCAIVLFVTEKLSVDLIGMLILISLVIPGVITPEEGVAGFSNDATLTVAFMFVLSYALLKTGALQMIGPRLARYYRKNTRTGIIFMMLIVGLVSAFINNTPVVAVFIPVVVQIAYTSNISPSKMLIPLSFASIFGGTCSLIGTSTNILVSGMAVKNGLEPIGMFQLTPLGLVFLGVGILYMIFFGLKVLPDRKPVKDFNNDFHLRDYLAEIELLSNSDSIGKSIMESPLVKEMELEIIEIRRKSSRFSLPPGDMRLLEGDILKVRCDLDKIKNLKDRVKSDARPPIRVNENILSGRGSTLVEMVISANSEFEGKTLKEVDFRRKYRAIPLAIKHREEIVDKKIHEVNLKSGDVILAEVKTHYISKLKQRERELESPFIILSQETLTDFNRKNFFIVLGVITAVVVLATTGIVSIMVGTITGVTFLVLSRVLNMKEIYEAINWKIIFLMAGALSLGTAMNNSELASILSNKVINGLGKWGPIAIISGLYLLTSLLTAVISNIATAALLVPIAISTATNLGVDPLPFIMAITFAASASFITPVGYQTNTMIYSAGNYRFKDFIKVGTALNIIFWIIATLLIPIFYPLV